MFAGAAEFIVVADAGAPRRNAVERRPRPPLTFPAMHRAIFRQGRANPEEGGPKGLDVDSDLNVMVVTSKFQTLAFLRPCRVLYERVAPPTRHRR
jgi:hypothetical protein